MSRFNTRESLTKSLAPNTLDEVVGQHKVVKQLKLIAAQPYATGFLFHGATGCGKNCTARAFAGAVGCNITGSLMERQWSGYFDLCGSSLTAPEVEARLHGAHYRALNSKGWKVIVVSEADKLKEDARNLFLFTLDNLPPSTIWIFTTNWMGEMDRRFYSRCEQFEFESDAKVLIPEANRWLTSLWKEAGLNHAPPTVADFPLAVAGGHLSFRAVVLGLQLAILERKILD